MPVHQVRDGNTTNKDGGVGIAGRDVQIIDPDLVVGTAVVGIDSCLDDQCGLPFSNGPGVTGGFPSATASNDIARAGSAAAVAGEIRAIKVVTPETATGIATVSVTIKTQEPGRCIDRVTGFQSSDVSDKNLWGAADGVFGHGEAVVAGVRLSIGVLS